MTNQRIGKAEQTEITTRRLLDVGRELFALQGYADTKIEEIVLAVGLTRGALYHHYKNKEALFRAVFLELESEIGARVAQASSKESDDWGRFIAGCREFLRACLDPAIRQIVMLDAPAVLGMDSWRSADEEHSTYLLRESLAHLQTVGKIAEVDVDGLTALLNGALNDAALWIASSANSEAAFEQAARGFELLAKGLRTAD